MTKKDFSSKFFVPTFCIMEVPIFIDGKSHFLTLKFRHFSTRTSASIFGFGFEKLPLTNLPNFIVKFHRTSIWWKISPILEWKNPPHQHNLEPPSYCLFLLHISLFHSTRPDFILIPLQFCNIKKTLKWKRRRKRGTCEHVCGWTAHAAGSTSRKMSIF